jgi:hypothetical protein
VRATSLLRSFALTLGLATACSPADETPTKSALAGSPAGADSSTISAGSGAAPTTAPISQSGCKAPAGVSTAPHSIGDVIQLLNVLPKPTSVPCLLEALEHPLAVQATYSVLSAQPADGMRSPRIFLFFDPLLLSVVPAGGGTHLLEIGERRSESISLKGELEFPIEAALAPTAPFDRLQFNAQTSTSTCGFCHQNEQPAAGIDHPFARISQAMRPMASQHVSLAAMQNETAICDPASEPDRCAMLHAIFDRSEPALEREFPTTYKTFF